MFLSCVIWVVIRKGIDERSCDEAETIEWPTCNFWLISVQVQFGKGQLFSLVALRGAVSAPLSSHLRSLLPAFFPSFRSSFSLRGPVESLLFLEDSCSCLTDFLENFMKLESASVWVRRLFVIVTQLRGPCGQLIENKHQNSSLKLKVACLRVSFRDSSKVIWRD